MPPIFRNSSPSGKFLNQSKSSFILFLTLFVAIIVACVMFVNKEALAEESSPSNALYPSTVNVKPNDQTGNLETVQFIMSSDKTGINYTLISNYADSQYSVKWSNVASESSEGIYKWNNPDSRIIWWKLQSKSGSFVSETIPLSGFSSETKNCLIRRVSGYFPQNIDVYIGTNHYYETNVEGGTIDLVDGSSISTGTFEAAYGSNYGDLSMSIDDNYYLEYNTGAQGDSVWFEIKPEDGYALDKVELRKASDDTVLAPVTADSSASDIEEVADKIVPIFKKLEYIGVSGSVYGNMYEPLEGAEIYDVTDQSNPKLVTTTDADGNFNFKSLKGEVHKFSISDPSGTLTPDVFEITEEQAQEDVNAGTFYLVDGAEIEIVTSGEGFNGINVIAEKDGTVYYEGPYEGANIALSEGGEFSVDENGNLIYTYSYTDGEGTTHNYLLTFTPNALEGYHVDSWKINDNTIKFEDDPYVITSDDVDNGLKAEPVMAANPIDPDDPVIPDDPVNPGVEVKATAQTGDSNAVAFVGLTTLIALTGGCVLRFRKGN